MRESLRSCRISLFILAQVIAAAAARGAEPSWLDPDRSEPAGARYRTFASKLAGGEVSYLVYLPPDYQTAVTRRYAVVYWLHGLGGNPRRGIPLVEQLDGAIRIGKAPAMIVILVNGMRDSFYCDSADGKWPVESVIVKELIPHVDQTYRTIAKREARAVEGFSMGGYGAAHLGFKHPEVFGIVGVMAGALVESEYLAARHADAFRKTYGADKAYFEANDPATLLRKNADAIRGQTAVRIAVGDQDELQPRSQALHELLGRLKIEHEYEVVPGVPHNPRQFYETLGQRGLAFYQKTLNPTGSQRPRPAQTGNASAPSHVLRRGALEILTYETEADYDRLQELYRTSQDSPPLPGALSTRYYRSNIDGSVQPYAVWLPRDYSPQRKYPLVVQLHGLNFKEVLSGTRLKYRGMGGSQWIEPHLPVIYASCFGRPSAFYQGMGEVDVLEVIEEVQQQFPVDPDRVFIMGHSMGGAGSYTVGLHHPDLFGGIMPVDAALWNRPEDVPQWMEPQVAIVSVPKLYPNARNVDVFFKNAGAGIQRRSTEFDDGIVAQGGLATSESLPGMPHNFGDVYAYANFVTELIGHPVRRTPAEVKFYTNTLKYNRAYWLTIDRLTRHNADALVGATCDDGGLRVTTTNIDALTLRLGDAPIPKGQSTALVIDGREVLSGPLPEVVHLVKSDGQWKPGQWKSDGLVKRHGLQGPIGDAFNSRFLAVYGEGDRELAIAELDAIRNPPGPLDIHGDFPMKPAAKVTREDVDSANLILFGTPESNPVLKRLAASLPPPLLQAGSISIYPNPENPQRYVVVWSAKLLSAADPGLHAGWIMPLNLLPDYVQVKQGKVVSGGHFDNQWKAPSF